MHTHTHTFTRLFSQYVAIVLVRRHWLTLRVLLLGLEGKAGSTVGGCGRGDSQGDDCGREAFF
jgi:hypothetical protein